MENKKNPLSKDIFNKDERDSVLPSRENLIFADLHIHSRFSRACSKDITIDNLVKWAKIKGLDLLGTGDFTHPQWFKEIKEKLSDNGKGFFIHNEIGFPFVLSGEISLMYSDSGKPRKIHLVLLVPDLNTAEKINSYFDTKGRRDYDGRPIFGMSAEQFVKDIKEINDLIEIIPAHIWTPWFGIFGSMSGFDSLKECFKSQADKIFAIETGISSDPPMNWRIKELEDRAIVSFSDSHSFWPWRLGREATIFKKTDSFRDLISQIRENDFIGTIETDPAYGKYHWDGHRICSFSSSPKETKKLNGICPVCKKPLVVGVENRVEKIAQNPEGFKPENAKIFYKLFPLHELLSFYYDSGLNSKKIWEIYNELIKIFNNEFNILIYVPEEELLKKGIEKGFIDLIMQNRKGSIKIKPGYDGVYGKIILDKKTIKKESQKTLF